MFYLVILTSLVLVNLRRKNGLICNLYGYVIGAVKLILSQTIGLICNLYGKCFRIEITCLSSYSYVREGRYGVPRAGSLSIDEQHRIKQFNQMSARNMQQSGLPPGSHSGSRMLPGGTSMGVMSGMNRSMTMARPAFQGIAPSSMLNPGVPPGNMHHGLAPNQGNSVRPREALHMMRVKVIYSIIKFHLYVQMTEMRVVPFRLARFRFSCFYFLPLRNFFVAAEPE